MDRTRSLAKNTLILFTARFSSQIANFFLLPLYTNILTTDEYGVIDIISTVITVLLPIFTIQVEMGVFRYYILAKDDEERTDVVISGGGILMVSSLLASIAYIIICPWIGFEYWKMVLCIILCQGANSFFLQLLRAQGDNLGFGVTSAITSVFTTLMGALFVGKLCLGVRGYLYGVLVAQLIGTIILIARSNIGRFIETGFHQLTKTKEIVSYSAPLILNQLSSWVVNFSDRLIVLYFLGVGMNGIYAASNKLASIMNGVMSVFNIAWTENLIRNLKAEKNDEYINRTFMWIHEFLFLISGIIIGILPFAYSYIIGRNFIASYNHVPILLLAMIFSGTSAFLGSVFVAVGDTKTVAFSTTCSAILNVIIHICLVNNIGLYAASISTLLTFLVMYIYRMIYIRRIIKIRLIRNEAIHVMVAFLLLLITAAGYYFKCAFLMLVMDIFMLCLMCLRIRKWLVPSINNR